MSPMGAVFSHLGCRRAATQFGRGLGFASMVQASAISATNPALQNTSSTGPSSASTMSLPVLGDMTSFMNILDKGVDIFAKYNLAKKGKTVVTETGGSDTPGISPGTRGGSLFGATAPASRTVLTIGGMALGGLVLWLILKK